MLTVPPPLILVYILFMLWALKHDYDSKVIRNQIDSYLNARIKSLENNFAKFNEENEKWNKVKDMKIKKLEMKMKMVLELELETCAKDVSDACASPMHEN